MGAPLREKPPTGNATWLAVCVAVLGVLAGVLVWAAKLPPLTLPDRKPAAEQADQSGEPTDGSTPPQVAGAQTDNQSAETIEYVAPEDTKPSTTPTSDTSQDSYRIVATSDGDTVKAEIDGKVETIRLIGVDTPETKDPRKPVQCFGQQAADFTATSLLGQYVRLAADSSQQNRDKYGRLLRYIYLTDGSNFNDALVRQGYAYEYTYKTPYSFQAQFKEAQTEAQQNDRGLWSPQTCNGQRQ